MEKPDAGNKEKFELPFDEVVVFSANLAPQDLADEGLLRRIGCQIKRGYARPEECVEMLHGECARPGLAFRAEAVRRLMDAEHPPRKMPHCASRSDDILNRVAEVCRYEGRTPVLDAELVSRACRDSFAGL